MARELGADWDHDPLQEQRKRVRAAEEHAAEHKRAVSDALWAIRKVGRHCAV